MVSKLLLLALLAAPASQPTKSIAVLDIAAKGAVPKGSADVFAEMLQSGIRGLGYKVVGKSDIEQMLGLERMKDSIGCGDAQCMAEIGGALGVDELVSGVIARVGSYWVITVKRIDPKRSNVLKQVVKSLKTVEACLKAGDPGTALFMLTLITMELGDFKATSNYLQRLKIEEPDLYRNVKHFESMMPVD